MTQTEAARDSFGRFIGNSDMTMDPPDGPEPDADLLDDVFDQPDASILDEKPRSKKAVAYEQKMKGLFGLGFRLTVPHEQTQADAAAILMFGGDISTAAGDLAAENEWVAKAIDMLTEGSDNAALALITASIPFALQILRNHEPEVEATPEMGRLIKIPFKKEPIKVRFRIRLRRARMWTVPPENLKDHVFSNPDVSMKLASQGIKV